MSKSWIKDTYWGNKSSIRTQALSKCMNIVIGTLNQLFIRGFYTEITLSKKQIN